MDRNREIEIDFSARLSQFIDFYRSAKKKETAGKLQPPSVNLTSA
jgi:hypothetical protein